MGMRSLSLAGTCDIFTSQTLSAVYVRFERSPNLCSQPNFQVPLFIASKDPMYWLDLERSQKVDLGTCRSQGPIRSLSLEVKRLRRTRNVPESGTYGKLELNH